MIPSSFSIEGDFGVLDLDQRAETDQQELAGVSFCHAPRRLIRSAARRAFGASGFQAIKPQIKASEN
jgi:hypothetical protein